MSLRMRAVVAVGLLIGFYLLAIASVVGLVVLGAFVATSVSQESEAFGLAMAVVVVAFGMAVIIAWSSFPRWDRFRAPGPELSRSAHPRLFAVLEDIARRTKQAMPRHVYATLKLNASVTQRGGILGLGSKRVLVLGLPLMRVLTIDELRAVLAHEMGHFASGDIALAPFIHKARNAMFRIFDNITKLDGLEGYEPSVIVRVLRAPVHWLLNRFARITEAISRAQELAADALAVEVVGAHAVIGGLEKTHVADVAFAAYFDDEVIPVLGLGFVPPIGDGFSRFVDDDRLPKLVAKILPMQLAQVQRTPYDSHPPLADRIAAIRKDETRAVETSRAITLVTDASGVELAIFRSLPNVPCESISWDAVPAAFEKHWRERVGLEAKLLARFRADDFPTNEPTIALASWGPMITCALAVQLLDAGFELTTSIGEPTLFRRGELAIDLFAEIRELFAGTIERDAWNARWTQRGLPVRALA